MGSWITQNFLENRWQAETEYLYRTQLLISIEEGHLNEWMITLVEEQAAEQPKEQIIRDAAMKASLHNSNILTWARARVLPTETHSQLLEDKREFQDIVTRLHTEGNTEELMRLTAGLNLLAASENPSLIALYGERYDDFRRKEQFANNVFLSLYIAGTMLVGVDFVRQRSRRREQS